MVVVVVAMTIMLMQGHGLNLTQTVLLGYDRGVVRVAHELSGVIAPQRSGAGPA
jgi:hypothetical protein